MTDWYCPSCHLEHRTTDPAISGAMHRCAAFAGLTVPFVTKGTKASIEVREREDYVGQEDVFLHEGRPVMSIVTTRETGQDVVVFAPTAHAEGVSRGLVR